jgi:hypothetical protein
MVKAIIVTSIAVLAAIPAASQTSRTPAAASGCPLQGSYRINVAESDKLYSVVKDATSTVAFGDQQRFFMDLSTRLTPPDMLAIECEGSRVNVGSSRAPRITYLADGRTRRERGVSGNFVNSKVEMTGGTLSFISRGVGEDNINVTFQSIAGGDRMRVVRRIYAHQLVDPVVIRTVYDKIDDNVDWNNYAVNTAARQRSNNAQTSSSSTAIPSRRDSDFAADLRGALDAWIDATNRRDIPAQMQFYMPELKAYYLSRDTPQSLVLAEKNRVFAGLRSVDIRTGEPEIIFQDNGTIAVMRFIKEYRLSGRNGAKSGVVVQELRWKRTTNGWRIFSERDVRVIR